MLQGCSSFLPTIACSQELLTGGGGFGPPVVTAAITPPAPGQTRRPTLPAPAWTRPKERLSRSAKIAQLRNWLFKHISVEATQPLR
jgi:hypothetical protein